MMSSQWIRIVGSQFAEQRQPLNARSVNIGADEPATLFGQSRAQDLIGQFQDVHWLTLSAASLHLPGAQIADVFGPDHGWTAYGDRILLEAIDRPINVNDLTA
jgi:hypothetical protein